MFALQVALGMVGIGVAALALAVAARAVTLESPSSNAVVEACRRFVLPQLSIGSVTALGLGSIAFAVLGLATKCALRQARDGRRFFRRLPVLGRTPDGLAIVFADDRPRAFCAGLLHPRVYISTGAIDALADDELAAVLAHEAHHARQYDPLRIAFVRMLGEALFFLPVLQRLADRYAELAELAADAAALRRHRGDPRPLAAALLAFDERASSTVVGIAPERVDHLLGERPRWELPVALLAWAAVVVIALVVVAMRADDATAHTAISLPLLAAQLCMVAMAVGPLVVGASAVLASRRFFTAASR